MEKMKFQKITLFSGVMLALNSLIGSGWLFGAGTAAKVAGPAAILSWILGAIIIISIALTYVELGAMFPESGGMSRYAQYSHGPFLGFIAAWANWISLITLVPMEAVASVQYMSSWPWAWANWTHHFMKNGNITTPGLLVVFGFMLVFTLINFWSVKLMTRFTNLISIFKILLPTLTIVMLIVAGLILFPGSLIGAFISPFAGTLADRYGFATPVISGGILLVIGTSCFGIFQRHLTPLLIMLFFVVLRIGFNFAFSNTISNASMLVQPQNAPDVNSIFNMVQQFAGSLGTSLLASTIALFQMGNSGSLMGRTYAGGQFDFILLGVLAIITLLTMVTNYRMQQKKESISQ